MTNPNIPQPVRLKRLEITDFKALDHLVLDFPLPILPGDPDVLVMGSRNGVGKTSVMEACILLFLAILFEETMIQAARHPAFPMKFPDFFIRAGTDQAIITGVLDNGHYEECTTLIMNKNGNITIAGDARRFYVYKSFKEPPMDILARTLYSLAGLSTDPLNLDPCFFFHSYRKIKEGYIDLNMLMGSKKDASPEVNPGIHPQQSAFKMEILRNMMGKAEMFEFAYDDAEATMSQLNALISQYAGGTIQKLRPSGNTVDLRLTPNQGGATFSIDGLSSGQKEIISTLFLIWYYTQNNPGIILIDEPELYLNTDWHWNIIRRIHKLAPHNQYIIATHSADIFGSVKPECRVILQPSKGDTP